MFNLTPYYYLSTSALFRHCTILIFILNQAPYKELFFLKELPVDALGSDLSSQLRASLTPTLLHVLHVQDYRNIFSRIGNTAYHTSC